MNLGFTIRAVFAVVIFSYVGSGMAVAVTDSAAKGAAAARLPAELAHNAAITPVTVEPEVLSLIASKWNNQFTHVVYPTQSLEKVITVRPGESIQAAIDSASAAGGGVVLMKSGIHVLTSQSC